MTDTFLKVIKIFIGSPGGLAEERGLARRIIDEINQSHAEHWGCELKLIGWELTLPGHSRAQTLINQDLDKCDYFVGVVWNHWGSKPDDGDSRYSSGFEEEFHRAQDRLESGLMKDIALFFKEIPDVQLQDQGPSVAKVVGFRKECIERRKPLFKDFKDLQDFGSLFRAKIEEIGWRESPRIGEAQPSSQIERPEQVSVEEHAPLTPSTNNRLISSTSAEFLSSLLKRGADWDETAPHEVARLRLIAATISRQGNDDLTLGNHDANLLFEKRSQIQFSGQELRALIDSGVAGFHYQNVPLWSWLSQSIENGYNRIQFLSLFGSSQKKLTLFDF